MNPVKWPSVCLILLLWPLFQTKIAHRPLENHRNVKVPQRISKLFLLNTHPHTNSSLLVVLQPERRVFKQSGRCSTISSFPPCPSCLVFIVAIAAFILLTKIIRNFIFKRRLRQRIQAASSSYIATIIPHHQSLAAVSLWGGFSVVVQSAPLRIWLHHHPNKRPPANRVGVTWLNRNELELIVSHLH